MSATVADDNTQRYLDAFKTHGGPRGDERLGELRRAALERFAANGFPSTRVEEWKYTNLRPLARREFSAAPETPSTRPDATDLPLADVELPTVVLVNGVYSRQLSRLDRVPHGVKINSIAAVLAEQPALLDAHIAANLEDNGGAADSLAALNTAFFNDGAMVTIEADARIEQPLHVLFVSTRAENSVVCHPRIIVNAGTLSESSIIEHHIGLDDAVNFSNSVAEIQLDKGATCHHYRIQQENQKSFHISHARVRQARDSCYSSLNVDLGGMLVRHDLHAHLDEAGAQAILDGLFVLGGRQHCDNHTWVHHASPHTRSRERYKGILAGRSRGVFNGKVEVAPLAQKVDSNQASHNLLLSDNAEIDTKPELEIYADDVKCNHGATVGQLDDNALFYLRSRGLDADQARRLLTMAFAREMLDSIGFDPLKEYLERALQSAM
jgi:Fe-S cluster assembly protein SufD